MVAAVERITATKPTWEAFAASVDRWVWLLAGKLARRFPPMETEDARQELLMRLFKVFPKWNPERSSPTTWASRMAAQLAWTIKDRRGRRGRFAPDTMPVDDDGQAITYMLADGRIPDPAEEAAANESRNDFTKAMPQLLKRLHAHEQHVLAARFGLAEGDVKTLAEVADGMGVTRQRVQQIEAGALKKLAGYLGEDVENVRAGHHVRKRATA